MEKCKDSHGEFGPSNLDYVGDMLDTETDRLLHVWEMDPRMFGVPQSRKGLWRTTRPGRFFEALVPEIEVHKMLNTFTTDRRTTWLISRSQNSIMNTQRL